MTRLGKGTVVWAATCPACGAQHVVWRLIRWPWQSRTRFVCYGCFYRWSVPDGT